MDLKIVNKHNNALLSRAEIEAEATFFNEPTPKKADVKKKISSMEKADEKLVVVKSIYNDFGDGKAKVSAYVYTSEEGLKKTEPKKKERKGAKPAEGATGGGEEASKEKPEVKKE